MKNKLKAATRKRAADNAIEISPYHALHHSFIIQPSLSPTPQTVQVAVSFFDENIIPLFTENNKRLLKKDDKLRQFLCLVGSLSFASVIKPLRVSLNKNSYKSNEYLSTFTIVLINWLHANGYLSMLKGTNLKREGGKKWTRIAPTKKLREKLLDRIDIVSTPTILKSTDLVILKSEKKSPNEKAKPIEYKKTRQSRELAEITRRINISNAKHRIVLPVTKTKRQVIIADLHRVFNNQSFECNGRFYTGTLGYQRLPKEYRGVTSMITN